MSDKAFLLYDSLSRQVKPLQTLEPKKLTFYSCGPTVYSYAHIGNFRSFLTADLIVRTARSLGWSVKWVSNITDVGHLTQDDVADAGGEDRMEKALRSKEGENFNNVWELAEYYTDAYAKDWHTLNLVEPTVRPKATQHVREQILAAEELIKKGFGYETPSGVYFNVDSFPGYGKLSGNTRDKLRDAVRDVVIDETKRDQADFAIWKKDDKHLMQWFSPYGWGFPGWHIECSVMARAYLGDTIDLHSGGEDNKFPHHECEIAQSEALTGQTFCGHWVHTRFLLVNGEKMSKSLGNFYTVRDLIANGADPLGVRMALMSTHFNKELNFTDQTLQDATGNVQRLRRADAAADAAIEAGQPGEDNLAETLAALLEGALDAMCHDLNTAVAIAKALEGAKAIQREADNLNAASGASAKNFLNKINDLLGIVRGLYEQAAPVAKAAPTVDEAWIEGKIAERAEARKSKDFKRSDAIRDELAEKGVELRDTPTGVEWSLKA